MSSLTLMTPPDFEARYQVLTPVTLHDLGLEPLFQKVAKKKGEAEILRGFLANMSDQPEITKYRIDIFEDILHFPDMRKRMLTLLEQIDFLKSYGTFRRNQDETSNAWDLMHRLAELNDYIQCVEAIHDCLNQVPIQSEGLIRLREYIRDLFETQGLEQMKTDIGNLRADTSHIRSVTLGINLNERMEAESMGIVSINSKPFSKAGILSNFMDHLSSQDKVQNSEEWNDTYRYEPAGAQDLTQGMESLGRMHTMISHPLLASSLAPVPEGDESRDSMQYLDRIATNMISLSVKKLREVLRRYANISMTDISSLIPEFLYYIRFAEYVEERMQKGIPFCRPTVLFENPEARSLHAGGIFNLKLMELAEKDMSDITSNDLFFDADHRVLILTGANRGGKTTITQAVGQYFVLAQGGIFLPGTEFVFHPVDAVYTHFPADEDKTFDLGRLGEECRRFRELYRSATKNSLILLNESFSTTSFEEGYYIAADAVRALVRTGIRTIYNTHMHKLAYEADSFTTPESDGKAASLIVESREGERTYKVQFAPPEGISHARDIARKYGVTYEQLVDHS